LTFHFTGATETVQAAAISVAGCHGLGVISRFWRQIEGLPNLLEMGFGCHALHFVDELTKMTDVVWVELQVAVPTAFDPQWLIGLPSSFP